jgi:HEPN domain-containing protein
MWIRRAESDLKLAEKEVASASPVWDAICFHSHACVEKLLKALIVRQGTFPPRTHNLLDLLARQSPAIRDHVAITRACKLLTDLYPKSRYPEQPEPTPDEAKSAIAAARQVYAEVRPRLPA